ncbi:MULTISPECIES: D-2-hydroxyacid dehydrogenase [unclassified Ruminococcus]|uniref:D-2-hydroxyacid dehydrogenase n=1 Tax=unclassified Ruminococcus TaxID=2608920 RepID=UPI00210D935B|nr:MULTISPECIES: D-2-hydroxyacid dehydrogenase [unclassified Ruminococcus]MCQ4021995.1 D-2-hydroxyacid dehydrogenase [Ruminococcus sp. zg-924]MCQ4114531.1 D-2-hydroxyacid dehydrogenase [Ruminococcus sp. zg-921]
MKIVLTDVITITKGEDDLSLAPLKERGEIVSYPFTDYDEISERINDADAVICNKTRLDSESLKNAEKLKYIGLWATGFDNIDIPYCRSHNITVCNAGSYSTNAVAQHTFALILEHYSKTGAYNNFVQGGGWRKSLTFSPIAFRTNELFGKTIGIVGYGTIGKAVAKIANAFGMRVLAYNRSGVTDEFAEYAPLPELYSQSDIVSAHCPLNEDSNLMFGKKAFSMFKDGSLFVNTARGGLVDEAALKEAVISKHLSGAAVDVLFPEPMNSECVLSGVPNITITPHIAWAPIETRKRLLSIVCDNLKAFQNGTPVNVIG